MRAGIGYRKKKYWTVYERIIELGFGFGFSSDQMDVAPLIHLQDREFERMRKT